MLRGNSSSICLVSILSMLFLAPIVLDSSSAKTSTVATLEFDQVDGIHYSNLINISGSSSVPLNSVEITLWNVTSHDQYELLNSSSSLLTVTPYETDSGVTNW